MPSSYPTAADWSWTLALLGLQVHVSTPPKPPVSKHWLQRLLRCPRHSGPGLGRHLLSKLVPWQLLFICSSVGFLAFQKSVLEAVRGGGDGNTIHFMWYTQFPEATPFFFFPETFEV